MRPLRPLLGLFVPLSLVLTGLVTQPAQAASPGFNGRIVYVQNGDLFSVESDPFGIPIHGDDLVVGTGNDENPVWSPDGQQVAFTKDGTLWVVNADGTAAHQVIAHSVEGTPAWSPDGARLAYARDGVGLSILDADGTDPVQISSDTSAADVAWSSTGSRLAFTSFRDGNSEIYLIDSDGTDETRLTNSPTIDENPNWAPDGGKLAFDSDRDGDLDVYSIKPDGTLISNLGNLSGKQIDPAWSPDGLQIVYTLVTDFWTGIYKMNNNGTNAGGDVIDDGSPPSEAQADWQPLADDPPDPDFYDPTTTISRPRNNTSYYQANLRAIAGSALDIGGSGVASIQIALRRYFTNGTCANWNGSRFVAGSCDLRVWKDVTVAGLWTYNLPHVLTKSKGTTVKNYLVLGRSIDVAGNVESTFRNGHNRNLFEVI
jgi:TolB protein